MSAAGRVESAALPARGPRHAGLLLGFALATLALHAAAMTRYGYFRDELYYLACARHLGWGYVDQPPLSIALLALVTRVLGDSLVAIRLLPVLAGMATVFLTGRLARRLGGGAFAQGLACLAALLAPVFLGTDHYFSMNSIDLLLWTVAALALFSALGSGRARDWMSLGVVLGLGLLNKLSVLWLGAGIAAGLVLTPHRRVVLTPGPWIASAVAGALFLPHVAWQAAHAWPTLEFMRNATGAKMAPVSPVEFVSRQVLAVGPANLLVWLPGLAFGLFARAGRPSRILAWVYLAVALLLAVGGRSRASYLALACPMLFALGGVALERWTSVPPGPRLRPAAIAIVLLLGLVPIPFALPILPVESFIRYQAALGMTPATEERHRMGPLPQHYADMFGWEELVAQVVEAYRRLTPEERRRAVVFGQNYGEAGAVDVLGRKLGLPRAISGHNSYWLWGPGDWDGSVLIIIGGDSEDNARWFESVERVGTADSPYAMPYERGLEVSIGRRLKVAPGEAWPKLKHFV